MADAVIYPAEGADLIAEVHYLVEAVSILTDRPTLEPSPSLALRINDVVNCLANIACRLLNDVRRMERLAPDAQDGGHHG